MNLKETLEYMTEDAQSNNTQITTKAQAGKSNNSKEYQKIVKTFDSRVNDMKKLYQKINKIYDALKADNIQISPELNQQLQTLNNNYTSLVKTYEDNEGFKKKLNDFIKSGGQGEKVEQPTESDKKEQQKRNDALNQYKKKNNRQMPQDTTNVRKPKGGARGDKSDGAIAQHNLNMSKITNQGQNQQPTV